MSEKTDWDSYYDRPVSTARYSRRFTEATLVELIRTYGANGGRNLDMVELGGANSCFFNRLRSEFTPRTYHVVDNNARGLEMFRQRAGNEAGLVLHQQDALNMDLQLQADMAFSVGLIEHFMEEGTRQVVDAHFRLLKPGGIAIITFPTPTWLYWSCRGMAELLGMWRFPDERPLRYAEVAAGVERHGTLLHHRVTWPIVLTQMIFVVKKHGAD